MKRKWLFCVLLLVVVFYVFTVFLELNFLSRGVEESLIASRPTHSAGLCPPTDHQPVSPPPPCPSQQPPSTVVLIGALSFMGSRVAAEFTAKGLTVNALADISETQNGNELVWYWKEQLRLMGVAVDIIDFSNETQVDSKVSSLFTDTSVMVYVPTLVMRSASDSVRMSQQAEEFTIILEVIRKTSPCTRTLLISDQTQPMSVSQGQHELIQLAWLETLELMLSVYHSLHALPFTVLRVEGLYGPWSEAALALHKFSRESKEVSQPLHLCWYISDVADLLHTAITRESRGCEILDLGGCEIRNVSLRSREDGLHSIEHTETELTLCTWHALGVKREALYSMAGGLKRTLTWAKAFTSTLALAERNVIFTSYFTSEMDPQRESHKRSDRFSYLSTWYKSVAKLSLNAVIFHDGLQSEFQHKLSQYHPGVSFQYVPSLIGRSTNDARFYAYLRYLEEQSDINKVILTDISDVQFQMDPFELLDLLGDWLYIGTDVDIFPNMQSMPWIHKRLRNCFGDYSVEEGVLHTLMQMDTVYNAGVIGGTRQRMLGMLSRVVGYLETTPGDLNCNMPAVNVAIHKHFFDSVFTGFPLTSRFLRKQISPKSVYIIHK